MTCFQLARFLVTISESFVTEFVFDQQQLVSSPRDYSVDLSLHATQIVEDIDELWGQKIVQI